MEMRSTEKDQEHSDSVNTTSTVSSLMASKGFKKKNWCKRFEMIEELSRTSVKTKKKKS